MRVHHLNCGTMTPPGVRGGLVCHVLLLETDDGLALVDSGYGLGDIAEPGRRIGPARFMTRPRFEPAETALQQVEALGHDPADVRDIVLTHFDSDHAGGLSDFPRARVHLTAAEHEGALHPASLIERERYQAAQREHDPDFVLHRPVDGTSWRGFAATTELTDIAPGVVLIWLPGHTRGHAAVAVDAGDRWVLHVGDAFYHPGQLGGEGRVPLPLTTLERVVAHDWRQVRANHERLTQLWASSDADLVLVNAHDPSLLARARARQ